MKHWPELTAVGVVVGLAVGSIASAGPVTVYPNCPRVECPEPYSEADCAAAADEQCRRYSGDGFRSYQWCAP